MRARDWAGISASIILGLIFLAAATGKFFATHQLLATEIHLQMFMTAQMASLVSNTVPWLELAFGLLLIIGIFAKLAAALSLPLIAGFIFTNGWLIAHGLSYEPCGCLGIVEKLLNVKLSTLDSLVFDIILLALVAVVLAYYPDKFIKRQPWFVRRGG
jgi:uncharacterized membrane protein YphA (DoxX/SURF4 family)